MSDIDEGGGIDDRPPDRDDPDDRPPGRDDPDDWPDGVRELSGSDLEAFVQRYPVALVEAGAEWCGPCTLLEPVLESLAADRAGEVAVGHLDADEHRETVQSYRRTSIRLLGRLPGSPAFIPVTFVFADGDLVDRVLGAKPRETFEAVLEPYL